MRGIAKGEQSSLTNPLLVLYVRSGGFLADIYSGSVVIEDIRAAGSSPAVVVASANITSGGNRLGIGRYVILTGSTALWNVGTHRATAQYKLTATGPTYYQVIEFEVLDSAEWPTGQPYVGYISTRLALGDAYVASTITRQQLHRYIDEVSHAVEMWTGRWFEPRYRIVKKRGQALPTLRLDTPIIAIEDIYAIWQTTTGQDSYKYEQYLYKVYNRHLDALMEEDDRKDPYIELTDVDGTVVEVSGFAWPYGNQNIEVRGVFGYTDPEFDPNSGQVIVGKTPSDLARAVGALTSRRISDPAMSSLLTSSPGGVVSMKTRDQSITFGSSTSSMSETAPFSGDPLIDQILIKYCKPWAFGAV